MPGTSGHRQGTGGYAALSAALAAAALLALLPDPAKAAERARIPFLAGVNLAGGEFNAAKRPGVYARNYIYPDAKVAKPFRAMGMNSVRLPVLWERIQRSPHGELDAKEMARIDKAIDALKGFDTIVLDIHNYGAFRGRKLDRIDDGAALFADLWRRLALRYRGKDGIAFGLMNEPNGIAPARWRVIADAAVQAIRETGARNLLLVPGSAWTTASRWTAGGSASNAAAFRDFRDPGGRALIEMHQYLDKDNSGTSKSCVSAEEAGRRLAAATAWLRATGHAGYLGEFGAPGSPECLKALDALMASLMRNRDVWRGYAYWAGGAWWGSYPMSIQPDAKGKRKPQADVLVRHLGKGR